MPRRGYSADISRSSVIATSAGRGRGWAPDSPAGGGSSARVGAWRVMATGAGRGRGWATDSPAADATPPAVTAERNRRRETGTGHLAGRWGERGRARGAGG